MTKEEKIIAEYTIAHRDFAKEWLREYDDYKNVSATNYAAYLTDAGQRYIKAGIELDLLKRKTTTSSS